MRRQWLPNLRKWGQTCEIYPKFSKFRAGNFRPFFFSRNFRLNDSLFGTDSTISEFSEHFHQEISLPDLSKFQNFRTFGEIESAPCRALM